MARSAQSELRYIAKLEEAARLDLERASKRRSQLVAPLAGKLGSVFTESVQEFLSDNIELVATLKFDKAMFEKKIAALLDEMFILGPAAEDREKPEKTEA